MGDQEPVIDHAPPVMDYVTADATSMPEADKFVVGEESAIDHAPPAIDHAPPAVNYDAVDTTGLSDVNKFPEDQEPSMDQPPPPIDYDTADATAIPNANEYIGDQESALSQAPPVTDYETGDATGMPDANQFTSTEHQADENGNAAIGDNREHEQPQFEELPAISTEEDRLWNIVRTNSADFNAWTSLIQETEKVAEDNLPKICKVYDAFLREFPLCYGYWKKYADHEARLGSVDKIVEVYERAVQAVTYSVDIWMHYCVFAISTYEDPDTIRSVDFTCMAKRLFERGLSYVGTDYLSYPLWDKYIEFEYTQQDWSRLAQIYTRILQIPIQQLDRYYNSFKELVASRPLAELRTVEENDAAAAAVAAAAAAAMEVGRERSEGNMDGGEEAPKPEVANLTEADELEKYLSVREVMYKRAKELDAKIRDFETAIRRPYFHVKALDDMQLANWHRYLDFIEKGNDFDRIVKLYERCLIACANYSEYWIRYVQCMEAAGSMEVANDALARATQVFVKRQPEIHIFAARFKEQMGDIPGARAEYQYLNGELAPGLLEAIVKHSNMEHRLGNIEAATSIYETAIATEKAKEESQSLPLLFIQYSRFLQLVAGNADRAREVLIGALELLPHSKPLLEVAVHLESIRPGPKQIDYLDSIVDKMTSPKPDSSQALNAADREEISSIFLEFVDLFGDIHAIKKTDVRHRQLFPPHKSSAASKKRPSHESIASDRVKVAKPYMTAPSVVSPAQSGMAAYPNGQSQWGVGYAQQSQTWQQPPPQQAPQMQPQQWNPGYGQQTGYGAYGGYANYGHPQQQPTPAQQPGYGSYGQGYPPQAFPQQNYGQPAPAYAPAQQQAPPAPQGYYAGYY